MLIVSDACLLWYFLVLIFSAFVFGLHFSQPTDLHGVAVPITLEAAAGHWGEMTALRKWDSSFIWLQISVAKPS